MNKYLPVENLSYVTLLTKDEVLEALSKNIEPRKSITLLKKPSYTKKYVGLLAENHFDISRAITYQNSFLPNIKGEISSTISGTRIKVTMKPHILVLTFSTLWIGGVFIACLFVTYQMITNGFEPGLLIVYFMLIAGFTMLYFGFKLESKRSINDLKEILQAKIV